MGILSLAALGLFTVLSITIQKRSSPRKGFEFPHGLYDYLCHVPFKLQTIVESSTMALSIGLEIGSRK
jgi:hypothetical protein